MIRVVRVLQATTDVDGVDPTVCRRTIVDLVGHSNNHSDSIDHRLKRS
jgi:hypothetical protein